MLKSLMWQSTPSDNIATQTMILQYYWNSCCKPRPKHTNPPLQKYNITTMSWSARMKIFFFLILMTKKEIWSLVYHYYNSNFFGTSHENPGLKWPKILVDWKIGLRRSRSLMIAPGLRSKLFWMILRSSSSVKSLLP